MVLVIGALILGFITAQLGTFTAEQRSIMDKISTASLMLLLFFPWAYRWVPIRNFWLPYRAWGG